MPKNSPTSEKEREGDGNEKEHEGEKEEKDKEGEGSRGEEEEKKDGKGGREEVMPSSAAKLGHYLICFPADGRQPTTEEAAIYSCANVPCTNPDTDPITRWYMEMFGVLAIKKTPSNGEKMQNNSDIQYYINAGFLPSNDSNAELSQNRILGLTYLNKHNILFIKNFQKIASTPVGRVLLYRLLIEIRRSYVNKNYSKIYKDSEYDVIKNENPMFICDRNQARSLKIGIADEHQLISGFDDKSTLTMFNHVNSMIYIANSEAKNKDLSSIAIGQATNGYREIIPIQDNYILDTIIFHEMVHWYHFLRNRARFCKEIIYCSGLKTYFLGRYYYGGMREGLFHNESESITSAKTWGKKLNFRKDPAIEFEEMRTIVGVPRLSEFYFEGDDISENLYRMCIGKDLRFGHIPLEYYEDERVVAKAISVCALAYLLYIGYTGSITYNGTDHVSFEYKDANKKGLGKCKYQEKKSIQPRKLDIIRKVCLYCHMVCSL
jgi:hypothetical protein